MTIFLTKNRLVSSHFRQFSTIFGQDASKVFELFRDSPKINKSSVTSYLGQPSPHTHPHLLKPDQVTQHISKSEYDERRQRLMFMLRQEGLSQGNSDPSIRNLLIFPAASLAHQAPDVPYHPFKQEANFFYLTGFMEPESFLVIHDDTKSKSAKSILFLAPKNPQKELWEGPRAGIEGALQLTGVDETGYLDDMRQFLAKFCSGKPNLNVFYDPAFLSTPTSCLSKTLFSDQTLARLAPKSAYKTVHELRWIKSKAEQTLMHLAGKAGSRAMEAAMRFARPGVEERNLVAKLDLESRLQGAEHLAYPPVVAGGNRANTIHYLNADQRIIDGEMVLIDAGCQLGGYCSDITRCWPINGRFTPPQLELYEMLLDVQKSVVNFTTKTRPFSLRDLYFKMIEELGDHLLKLGIVKRSDEKMRLADQYCPHHVGHYLGLDVHDTETVSKSLPVLPGVVITIEPGLYFPENDIRIPERFRGIGLRIEDDVLITETGIEVLTESCAKEVADIELLVGQG